MSCGGGNSLDFNSQPFGILRGPYVCRTNGCRFSMTAEIDLLRQGYTWDEIEEFRGAFSPDAISPEADRIRRDVARLVSVPVTRDLSVDEQNAINTLQQQIADRMGELEYYNNQVIIYPNEDGFRTYRDSIQVAIDRLTNRITEIEAGANGTVSIRGLDLLVNADNTNVGENPLNCYMDVQYHISLSMLSQAGALDFQKSGFNIAGAQIDLNTMKSATRADNTITLASTGHTLTNSGRNYYTIENLTVKNLMEPTESNPLVSTMLSMKMQIAEPHGFKLHEDIRDTALQLGYVDINPGRVLYRVDIYFSGYNQDTGQWDEQIDVSHGKGIRSISAVMGISAMEAEVTSSGTMYELDLVPAGHHAYRPEDFIIDANTFNSGTTFREFLANLSAGLKIAKEERTMGELIRNYEFFAPSALLDSPFDVSAFYHQNKQLFSGGDGSHIITPGKDVDIMTILEGALANTTLAQELFIADNANENFVNPRVHFGIRFNTIYGSPSGAITVDAGLNDYKEMTHQYIIEPFVTFKHGAVTKESLPTYVAADSQMQRIREIIRFGMLRRIYNYIYTAENTEIIDFGIKLKTFYYNSLNTTILTNATNREGFSGPAGDAIANTATIRDLFRVVALNAPSADSIDNTMRRLFGNGTNIQTGANGSVIRYGADRLGGGFNESPEGNLYGDVVANPSGRRNDYEVYMKDYLALDLLKLDGMKVRGDPVWLLSPYANNDLDGLQQINSQSSPTGSSDSRSLLVRPRQGQIIFLKIKAPNQDDHMSPSRQSASSSPNIIGGFYQITSVTSTFAGGKFVQSLDGIKLNHLNYAEDLFTTGVGGASPGQREPTFGGGTSDGGGASGAF